MLSLDTFLTILYVTIDDFCLQQAPIQRRPGRPTSLEASEVITLALLSQLWCFRSERDFYRYAQRHLKTAFPNLPDRAQLNRLMRKHWQLLVAFWQQGVDELQAQAVLYEILDTVPIPVRNIKRRGRGWLAGQANIGWSTRLGWYNGFHGLIAVTPKGLITGFAFSEASAKDQPMASTFLALRCGALTGLPTTGRFRRAYYLADSGFEGKEFVPLWKEQFGAQFVVIPPRSRPGPWPKLWRKWLISLRQIVETVYDKLVNWFGLGSDRNHTLSGFQLRFAAKVALHNFLISLNLLAGREPLRFADLVGW